MLFDTGGNKDIYIYIYMYIYYNCMPVWYMYLTGYACNQYTTTKNKISEDTG